MKGHRSLGQKRWMRELVRRNKARSTGMKGTRPWRIWVGMKSRCNNPHNKDYHKYGGAGIKVCPQWASFAGFWKDMQEGYADELQLDRKNGKKGYSKINCRWATIRQQQRNRKSCRYVNTPKGRMLLIEAAEVFGIPYGCLKMRRHWPAHRLLEPKRPHVRK